MTDDPRPIRADALGDWLHLDQDRLDRMGRSCRWHRPPRTAAPQVGRSILGWMALRGLSSRLAGTHAATRGGRIRAPDGPGRRWSLLVLGRRGWMGRKQRGTYPPPLPPRVRLDFHPKVGNAAPASMHSCRPRNDPSPYRSFAASGYDRPCRPGLCRNLRRSRRRLRPPDRAL